jgi:hypothetical protein
MLKEVFHRGILDLGKFTNNRQGIEKLSQNTRLIKCCGDQNFCYRKCKNVSIPKQNKNVSFGF